MRKATWHDKELVVDIFTEVFAANTGTTWVLRESLNNRKGLRRLARYAFTRGMLKDGVFVSDNEKGIAICYRQNAGAFSLKGLWSEIVFALTAANIWRLPEIVGRESYRKKQRPASGDYLYYWFLGVLPHGQSAALELGIEMLELADKMQLPVYVETAVERIKPVYERYGFDTYHYWENKKKGIQFWFLKREPHTPYSPRRG